MESSEADQALLQHNEEALESRSKRQQIDDVRIKQVLLNLKQLKSLEILKSAVKNVTSNAKCMFLMLLSIVPFFAFIVFYEINIQDIMDAISKLLVQPSPISDMAYLYEDYAYHDKNEKRREYFRILLRLIPFYLILCPLVELFSLTITIIIGGKLYDGGKDLLTLKETINLVFSQKHNLKCLIITCFCVQLLSTCSLFGLFWPIANHYFFTTGDHFFFPSNFYVNTLSIVFHSAIFVVLLYKYLDWSALWNMAMVISVLEEENVSYALVKSSSYAKHCKQTGYELMLAFFTYDVVMRLPFLLAAMYEETIGVVLTSVVIGLVCLGHLVKWLALVLYFHDCKAKASVKKDDDELRKDQEASEVC